MLKRACTIVLLGLVASGCQARYLDPSSGASPVSPSGQPTPAIVSITPSSAKVGSTVTVAGINFGNTQGSNSVTFNGVAATATTWATNSLVVTVPTGAATGSVVVNAGGLPSNGMAFTVTP